MKPKALVLKVAGTNCDLETCRAFEIAGADWDLVHINELLNGSKLIGSYQLIALAGGFSYGDDISAAIVLATKIRARLLDDLKAAIAGGAPVLGICNGFQVLIKTGILPGDEIGASTLFFNDSYMFECRWVTLMPGDSKCVFTKGLTEPIQMPVAHMEGKFIAEVDTASSLISSKRVAFRYCNPDGSPADGKFPINPNGSIGDIAGIIDSSGLVLGMMPHPERHLSGSNHPEWSRNGIEAEGDGVALFRNAVNFVVDA